MVEAAKRNKVVARVAENFFRAPIDRFAQTVRDSGHLGRMVRIVCYADHTGYHNNSRWIAFAQQHPEWVQAIEHDTASAPFGGPPASTTETFRGRFYSFPNDMLVVDMAANIKGFLGRHPRPGYTEWQGERGTLVQRSALSSRGRHRVFDGGLVHETGPPGVYEETIRVEVRRYRDFERDQNEPGNPYHAGMADEISTVHTDYDEHGTWVRMSCETSSGLLAHTNPYRLDRIINAEKPGYYSPLLDHLVDFVLAVRGMRQSEFTDEDALMSQMMEVAAGESVRQDGKKIRLPIEGDTETDDAIRRRIKQKLGVDPLDVEAMLALSYPKP
jgi:hypothetical protein